MVIRALKRNGFSVRHTTGSHFFLKKDNLRVSPFHNKDLKPGTLASIIAQAGCTVEANDMIYAGTRNPKVRVL